jgi:hypothetical protein
MVTGGAKRVAEDSRDRQGVRPGAVVVDRQPDTAADRAANAGDQELAAADGGVSQDGDLGRPRTVNWPERGRAGDGLVWLDCGYDGRAAVSRFGDQERHGDAVIEREQVPAGEPVVDDGGLGAEAAAPGLRGQVHAVRAAGCAAGFDVDLIGVGSLTGGGIDARQSV